VLVQDFRLLWNEWVKKKINQKKSNPNGGTSGCCLVSATGISAGRRAAAATLVGVGIGISIDAGRVAPPVTYLVFNARGEGEFESC